MHVRFSTSMRSAVRASVWWPAVVACLALPGIAAAATFNVNSTADLVDANPGNGSCATATAVCTLRAAIQEANALSGTDTINLGAVTYTLTRTGQTEDAASTGDLDITASVNIVGAGTTSTVLDAAGIDRVFDILPGVGAVNISALTIKNGFSGFGFVAGGIWNTGSLTLNGVRILDSVGRLGGGGIVNDNVLNATDVTISGCSSISQGGAIYNTGTATLTRVTISGNSSSALGGGIQNDDTLNLTNVTLSGNTAVTDGGAISNSQSATLKNVTIAFNSANRGGGIWSPADVTITNTIVANSTAGGNCGGAGSISSGGSNIDTGSTCGFSGTGDKNNTAAGLGTLGDYGGPTQTHILVAGSAAIDAGRSCPPPSTDQRGVMRAKDGNGDTIAVCDIGSVEIDGTPPTSTTSTSTTTTSSTSTTTSTTTPSSSSSSTSTSSTTSTSHSTTTSTSNTTSTSSPSSTSSTTSSSSTTTSTSSTTSTSETSSTSTSSTTSTSESTSTSTSTSTTTSSSSSTSSSSTTSTSSTTSSTTSTVPGLCGNGEIDPQETCGEDALPACASGELCVNCACRQLGDCQNNGGTPDIFDVIETIDLVLERHPPATEQLTLCDADCDADIDIFDVVSEIDVVLRRTEPPLTCPD